MSDTPPTELAIFWYALYYLRDPRRYSSMSTDEREQLEKKYTPDKILAMYDAIQWAIAHPSFGFVAEYKKHMASEPAMVGDDAAVLDYFKKIEEGVRPVVQRLRPP